MISMVALLMIGGFAALVAALILGVAFLALLVWEIVQDRIADARLPRRWSERVVQARRGPTVHRMA